ncbi:unnamed protein product [Sphagnum jensenii]|uniref:ABC transporter n=1 Tax=Sphagnum jensenii TaxID=128206 RepID=A0ABP1ARU8_9BRYO
MDGRMGAIVNSICSDTLRMQDAISEKLVGNYIHYMSMFVTGFAVGFSAEWRLALTITQVRTAYFFVGEKQALDSYSKALPDNFEAGLQDRNGKGAFSPAIRHFFFGQPAPNLQAFAKVKVAAYRIFEMAKQKPTINSMSIIDVGKQLQDLQGHVEFHNVEFSLPS